MCDKFQLNMNTRDYDNCCMYEFLNKNNNKILEHQFSVLNKRNEEYLDTKGLNSQNNYVKYVSRYFVILDLYIITPYSCKIVPASLEV